MTSDKPGLYPFGSEVVDKTGWAGYAEHTVRRSVQMPILPSDIMPVLLPFAQVFSDRTWQWVQVLIVGAILAPGTRTVTAILRVMGLSDEQQRSEEHTSELQSRQYLVCRLLLEKKKILS